MGRSERHEFPQEERGDDRESDERSVALTPQREDWAAEAMRRREAAGRSRPEKRLTLEAEARRRAAMIDFEERTAMDALRLRQRVARERLVGRLKARFARYMVVYALAPAAAVIEYGLEKRESEAPIEVDIEKLDPEATTERMQRIFTETLPKGWVDFEVQDVIFKDEDGLSLEGYGLTGKYADATAGAPSRLFVSPRSRIIFYRGAKGQSSGQLWNGTLLHEIAHANDWRSDHNLSGEEKERLHRAILARIAAPDRYRSDYVESIKWKDKDVESENKAIEYWAEMAEEYFRSPEPAKSLAAADRKIIEAVISKTDPGFDRKAAREKRGAIIADMEKPKRLAEARKALVENGVPKDEAAAFVEWSDRHSSIASDSATELKIDRRAQRAGRDALAAFLRSWGTTTERRNLAIEELAPYLWRWDMLRWMRMAGGEVDGRIIKNYASAAKEADEAARRFPSKKDADLFRRELERIMREHDVITGSGLGIDAELDPGEYAGLIDAAAPEGRYWIQTALQVHAAKEDVAWEIRRPTPAVKWISK